MEVSGQLHACTLGEETLHPSNNRLDRPQRRSGRFEEETNLVSLPGWEPRIVQHRSLVTVVAVLGSLV
jgi:hypothetical protein